MLHQDKEFSASDVLFNQTIKVFYAVYSSLNFTVAAKKLGITQSAVSQCIASLESQLGFDLFDRTTRPLSVTYEGQVLYDRIQRQLTDFAGTLDALRAKNFVRTTVRVGVIESIGRNLCPELILGMLKRGRRIKLHSGTSDFLYQELLKDKVDCIVATGLLLDAENLEHQFLYSEPHVVMMPTSVAKLRQNWTWENLSFCGIPMVRYTPNTGSGEQSEKVLRHAQIKLPNTLSVDDNQIIFTLVSAGMGWCLTQPLTALLAEHLFNHVTLMPAPNPCESRKIFVVRKHETPKIFSDEILQICRNILITKATPKIEGIMPWVKNQIKITNSIK
ncbi:LysR family transcriptional regulator [Serratia sp. (in: enterobacteria)]|uniref:LysR family transcriptional regulator n=1 Tax=Serratia sp. (in: enterobacteria) TaxID=616 RepID=UPI0039899B24